MTLQDRVVVITGATGGLGKVVAGVLAGQGARLGLLSSNPLKLEAAARDVGLPAERLVTHAGDLRQAESARAAGEAVQAAFGRVDVLLHLVGGWVGGIPLAEASADQLDDMLHQHVWTTFHMVQAFVPRMLANGWGRVIAVSSPSAVRPAARGGLYAAGKAAEEALLLSLSQELKDTGVTANILQVRTIDVGHERERARTPTNATWTTPEEIAAAVLYLCSDEAGVVNGARIPLFPGA